MQVIGTAGHVDHGKSTLINRLTGINPDRLKQEQDREMSIELGFAWFSLPNGEEIGIIDVPGHRDFIENMLSGIGGIDAALFVVAADEGVMPQTREHLAILDLLQIPAGVVALTKIDLIKEQEWLDLVEADLSETLAGTVLENAPIVRVSARSGEGIDALVLAIQEVLGKHPHRPDLGRPRLPVDRVFTLSGFGTIVTGTLMDGTLAVGDSVEVLPAGIEGRIRGLQTHKQAEEKALPGGRTAVNISGISHDQIERGNTLVHPGTIKPTKMIDVWCTLLPDVRESLKHNAEIKLFIGAAEVMARVRLLGVDKLAPGKDAFLQLMLQNPIVALRQDRFIIRRPSPPATIGGGQVVDPHPAKRHKRYNTARLEELEHLLVGTPEDILLQTARKLGASSLDELIKASGLENDQASKAGDNLISQGLLLELKNKQILMAADQFNLFKKRLADSLDAFHQQNPLKTGMPREQLKSQVGIGSTLFDAIIKQMHDALILEEIGAKLHLVGHEVRFSEEQQKMITTLLDQFDAAPFTPPSVKQSEELIGEELLAALLETGQLMRPGEDVLLQPKRYDEMKDAVISHIQAHGIISLAELRDMFDTSRKYAVAVLEQLDQSGVTIRQGDVRKLRRK
ncbi:MAG: selenocysteine-specific translation elongation factor [Brevefilum sp.]|nr:selenocysteine-specific translation elongation factor [Brevefilum sp.]MDT8381745.1 selenocysteine-specific translation elongation factor [Brevefilum sp.]MDW7754062.1 selenocysteine-specific translation elongation factor [Brevefilum sp.]